MAPNVKDNISDLNAGEFVIVLSLNELFFQQELEWCFILESFPDLSDRRLLQDRTRTLVLDLDSSDKPRPVSSIFPVKKGGMITVIVSDQVNSGIPPMVFWTMTRALHPISDRTNRKYTSTAINSVSRRMTIFDLRPRIA